MKALICLVVRCTFPAEKFLTFVHLSYHHYDEIFMIYAI